jgi:hypothetical protein
MPSGGSGPDNEGAGSVPPATKPAGGEPAGLRFEQMKQGRVTLDAQKQTDHRPNEHAAYRARLDNADSSSAYDARSRKGREADTKIDNPEDGSCPRRTGEDNAAQFLAETAGRPEGLASGIDFPIQMLKKRQSVHRQAMFVFFAVDEHFHQMLGKPFTGTLCLGTVCKSAIDVQRAIDGKNVHRIISSGWFKLLQRVRLVALYRSEK